MTDRKTIPTIAEIQGRTIASVRADGNRRDARGLDALMGLEGHALATEQRVHVHEQSIPGADFDRGTAIVTDEENRLLRLAVRHIAAALGVAQDDLRSIVLTPHVITARVLPQDASETPEFVGRVLR